MPTTGVYTCWFHGREFSPVIHTFYHGLTECPYDFPADTWKNDPTKWPEVQWPDIYNYLVDTPGVYSKQSMKNYKSLEAHNFFISGWVQIVKHMTTKGTTNTVFTADVRPSWRVTEVPHHPWVAVSSDGTVLTAHCDCMAGLGESCSHVGALLFKIEAAVRNGYTRLACTDVPCEWNKCFVKSVKAAPITEIKFYKEKVKERLRNSKRARKPPSSPPSPEKQKQFITNLMQQCTAEKPVGLSIFKESFHHFKFKETVLPVKRLPNSLKRLYNVENIKLSDAELKVKCEEVLSQMTATKEQVDYLCESTVSQSNSVVWHEQRYGRITASVAHSVIHTNADHPSQSLLKKICARNPSKVNTAALQWGRQHEATAFDEYKVVIASQHTNAVIKKTGMRVLQDKTFIGASPDGLLSCTCCGSGVIEIKCPFKYRNSDVDEMLSNEDCCLTANYVLKEKHAYYAQVQLQMHVFNHSFCHFVVWTNNACIITTVQYNDNFATDMIIKLENFWKNHCLPELLTCRITSLSEKKSSSRDSEVEVFCFCQTPGEDSDMIGCDSVSCKYKWFHYDCVNIKRAPKGKWYCKECKKTKS